MSLAPFVAALGRGPGRSRSLTQDEAFEAMRLIQSGRAAPEAVGAMLMLMRMKGETAAEIAGFAAAAAEYTNRLPKPDLDWPSYAAGRTRGLPWFLLSAKLVARAGYTVLLHGWNGQDTAVRDGIAELKIGRVRDVSGLRAVFETKRVAYMPLEALHPQLHDLLCLRDVFGLRSCMNTVARMLNPGQAAASVQGVFHPSYRLLQADAAKLLGLKSLTVIKGGGGEFERNPAKEIAGFGLRNGQSFEAPYANLIEDHRQMNDGQSDPKQLTAVWRGQQRAPYAEKVVVGTAALALETLGEARPEALATDLWNNRLTALAA